MNISVRAAITGKKADVLAIFTVHTSRTAVSSSSRTWMGTMNMKAIKGETQMWQ